MLFNSLEFILFFPLVLVLYYLTPGRFRWIVLLVASYYFYMNWKAKYAVLLAASTVSDYLLALLIAQTSKAAWRKLLLLCSITLNIGLLFILKYYNFFRDELLEMLRQLSLDQYFPFMWLALPVGISFYTFQTLSYTIDVYQGKQKPEKHLGIFALYVSFFPQLVAGPIEKFSTLGHQFKSIHPITMENLSRGFRLVLFGFFVKIAVADNLAPLVDEFYENPGSFSVVEAWLAIVFYSFQIYCDFFGYSLIALGAAAALGIKLSDNFNYPYLSVSIHEFWRRWHITLTGWFRDYVYLPLGGNRRTVVRWIFNILIVFLLSGFWHGANYTFVLWGFGHALFYLAENIASKWFNIKVVRFNPTIRFLLGVKTFLIVSLLWVLFRSPDLSTAGVVFKALFSSNLPIDFSHVSAIAMVAFFAMVLFEMVSRQNRFDIFIGKMPAYWRWTVYSLLLFAIATYGGVAVQPFIYFQF